MPSRPGEPSGRLPSPPERTRRPGSRLLLAVALAGVVAGALVGGAHVADILCDAAGVTSNPVRLGLKVACITAALPALFYLVERLFLSRAARKKQGPS
ncbi:MAG TPA: hypothetical protein VFU42_07480 [Candidatus Deferrimicrobiaceae bacterium]|nr:hypothetical protein [Candidatus Deferrimicrobiaceae bacterium]